MSAFQLSLKEHFPKMKTEDGFIATQPFLEACRQVLPVVEKLGAAFGLVRTDIGGNIERLAARYAKDPERYARLFTILQDEMVAKGHTASDSCAKGLLWLKRAMEFIMALLNRLDTDTDVTLSHAVSDTYTATLYRYHGFLVSSAFTLAFKFVPSREDFVSKLGPAEAVKADMPLYVQTFSSYLADIHTYLAENGLDDPAKV